MAAPHLLLMSMLDQSEMAPTRPSQVFGGHGRFGTAASSVRPRTRTIPTTSTTPLSVRIRSESSWSPLEMPPPGAAACAERIGAGCGSIPRRQRGRRVVGRASGESVVGSAASEVRVVDLSGHFRPWEEFEAIGGRMAPPDWPRWNIGANGACPAAGACRGSIRSCWFLRRLCVRCHHHRVEAVEAGAVPACRTSGSICAPGASYALG